MLEKVGFKNFLALRDVEIDLEPFTVIVGPNSSGKTSILEGIYRLSKVRFGNASNLLSFFRSRATTSEDFLALLNRNTTEQEIIFSFVDDPEYRNFYKMKWNSNNGRVEFDSYAKPLIEIDRGDFFAIEERKLDPEFMGKILKFSPDLAAKPSYTENTKPYLEITGQGLATVCSYLQNLDSDVFDKIQISLKKIIPNFIKFRIMPATVDVSDWFNLSDMGKYQSDLAERRSANGQELVFDFEKAKNIKASYVSEGTLFSLTILVLTALANEETIVLIDDIERGLHPKAVFSLMEALRELQKITPTLQIVATTHSPYVLHSMKPNEVRVATLDPERGTLIASLEAYPDFDKWRNEMTPGEFWSFVGEDWVKESPLEKTSV